MPTYTVAGKAIEIRLDGSRAGRILSRELAYYPRSTAAPELRVDATTTRFDEEERRTGPSLLLALPHTEVRWWRDGRLPRVDFRFLRDERNWLRKYAGNQFTHPFETIGQVFHEFALIPSLAFFFPREFAPIHAAAVADTLSRAVALTGLGGVGKTSLQLQMTLRGRYSFIADDIALVGRDGLLHPNYALPKVYGYNVDSDSLIADRLGLNGYRPGAMVWRAQRIFRAPNRLRRRATLESLYLSSVAKSSVPIRGVIFIQRDAVGALSINAIDIADALAAWRSALKIEMRNFDSLGLPTRVPAEIPFETADIYSAWENTIELALAGRRLGVLHVPIGLSAKQLKSNAPTLIEDFLNRADTGPTA